jgi:hypothetical protein
VNAVAVTPDGRFALSGSTDHSLRLWELATGACLRTFEGHTQEVNAVAMTPDGRFTLSGSGDFLQTGSGDTTLRLWELDWELDVAACEEAKAPRERRLRGGFWSRIGSFFTGRNNG